MNISLPRCCTATEGSFSLLNCAIVALTITGLSLQCSVFAQTKPESERAVTTPPSPTELRIYFARVINARTTQITNMKKRAYDAVTDNVEYGDGVRRDASAVFAAEEGIKRLAKNHGAQLAPALAVLCFDPDKQIESLATNLLKSLGDPAIVILSSEESDPKKTKCFKFALAKAFGGKSAKITTSLLWDEVLGHTQFSEFALDQLTDLPDGIQLEPIQMQFITKGVRSADDSISQDCLTIASLAKTLDSDALEAIGELALSSSPLADQATNILVKYRSQIKIISVDLIAKLANSQTHNLYGNDPTAHTRVSLARRIRVFKPEAKNLDPLVSRLADSTESHQVRLAISDLFYDAGEASLTPLIAMLKRSDTSRESRRQLLQSFGLINIASEPVLNELTQWVRKGDERERKIALEALRLMGPKASPTIGALIEATKDSRTGGDAMKAIRDILQNPDETMLLRLLPALESRVDHVQMYAADFFIALGSKAKVVLPEILRLSHSENTERAYIASILGTIGEPSREVVNRLMQMATENGGVTRRRRAIQSLGQLGTRARSAAPTLAKIVAQGRDRKERYAAIWTLIQLQDSSPLVIDALKTSYGESYPSEYERFSAVALISLGESAETYQDALADLLGDARTDLERKFADIAAQQMLSIDPDSQLAKDFIERQARDARFDEAVKKAAKERADPR